MSVKRQQSSMPKEKADEGGQKGIRIDQKDLAIFTAYMQEKLKPKSERKTNDELAAQYGVTNRTFLRKIVAVRKAMEELNRIAGHSEEPEEDDEVPAAPVQAPQKKKVPGALSQEALEGARNSEKALAVQHPDREAYLAIKTPTTNPLDGLSEGQVSQAGVAVGLVFGAGLAKMGKALSETDRPLGERAMEMAQGANATATMILGVFESLRVFGMFPEEPKQPKVIKGVVHDERR